MKVRLFVAALTAALMTLVLVSPAGAQTTSSTGVQLPTTTCTLSAVLGGGTCTVQLTGFQVIGGQVNAVLNVLNSAGDIVATITAPLQNLQATGTCQILNLTIGPIDLNLLGLMIHTDTIHLQITAQSGPGNLLGNLLCAVAHLLDNPSQQLTGLVNLLNDLLRQGGTLVIIPTV